MSDSVLISIPTGERRAVRLSLVAIAALNVIVGTAALVILVRLAWGGDASIYVQAAAELASGNYGTVVRFLYSPLAAWIAVPGTWLPFDWLLAGWLLVGIILLADGVRRDTVGLDRPDRVLAFVAALSFLPMVHNLVLGQITILITGAIAVVAWSRDRWLSGIPLGIVLATAPKPFLVLVLVWMLMYRRRSLVGTLITGALGLVVGAILLGVDRYTTWAHLLVSSNLADQRGNLALSAFLPPPLVVIASVAIVALAGLALLRGEAPGFVAVVACGLLVSPFTFAYGLIPVLLTARPVATAWPRAGLVLGLTGSIAVLVALPIWLGSMLVVALAAQRNSWPSMAHLAPKESFD